MRRRKRLIKKIHNAILGAITFMMFLIIALSPTTFFETPILSIALFAISFLWVEVFCRVNGLFYHH